MQHEFPHNQFGISHYTPEDLESMRRTFHRVCSENPSAMNSEKQRESMALAILNGYQPSIDETELISFALRTCSRVQQSSVASLK